jgi:pectinesterase
MEHPLFIVLVTLFIITSRGISQVSDCKPGNNGSKVAITIVVDQSGMGNFRAIQEAIDSIPANSDQWIKVQINPGTYT